MRSPRKRDLAVHGHEELDTPETALSVVVFPAPLLPMRATISPSQTSRSMPRTAGPRRTDGEATDGGSGSGGSSSVEAPAVPPGGGARATIRAGRSAGSSRPEVGLDDRPVRRHLGGVPSARIWPKSSTVTRSERSMTTSTWCSTSSTVSPRRAPSGRGISISPISRGCMPATGSSRISRSGPAREGTCDLEPPLVAEGQAAGRLVGAVGHSHEGEQLERLATRRRSSGRSRGASRTSGRGRCGSACGCRRSRSRARSCGARSGRSERSGRRRAGCGAAAAGRRGHVREEHPVRRRNGRCR